MRPPVPQKVCRPTNLIGFVYWRLDKPPFNDPRVRQAVSMSLNRDNTLAVLYNGRGGWDNFMPWALSEWWLDPQGPEQGDGAKYFKYDPAGAKQLLAAEAFLKVAASPSAWAKI